jgi:hypothetical protein
VSYSVKVKIKDGTAVIDSVSGTLPEGTIEVSGHQAVPEHGGHNSLGVTLKDTEDKYVISASHSEPPRG